MYTYINIYIFLLSIHSCAQFVQALDTLFQICCERHDADSNPDSSIPAIVQRYARGRSAACRCCSASCALASVCAAVSSLWRFPACTSLMGPQYRTVQYRTARLLFTCATNPLACNPNARFLHSCVPGCLSEVSGVASE